LILKGKSQQKYIEVSPTIETNRRFLHLLAFDGAPQPSRKIPSSIELGHFFVAKSMVMAGPDGVLKSLISLTFSWAKIRHFAVSFRIVPLCL